MALTIKEVEHVALLARLKLTGEEKENYAHKLGDILEYFSMLNELPTEGVEPLAHVLPLYNVMREDRIRPSLTNEEALANAPQQEDGQFVVPRIV